MSDVELATLREIPRGNFVQSNALYASTLQTDPDDSALPKIRREQITLAKFLGSGAFGKVNESQHTHFPDGTSPLFYDSIIYYVSPSSRK